MDDITDSQHCTPDPMTKKTEGKNEERTISADDHLKKERLKTVQSMENDNNEDKLVDRDISKKAKEYQHVKDAEDNIKNVTMDNATEEQYNSVQNDPNEISEGNDSESTRNDEILDEEDQVDDLLDIVDKLISRKSDNTTNDENGQSNIIQKENVHDDSTVAGDIIPTHTVTRENETIAHCSYVCFYLWKKHYIKSIKFSTSFSMDIIKDANSDQEISRAYINRMKRVVDVELERTEKYRVGKAEFHLWQSISNKMLPSARELCEQLRLILEPTKCTRLKGDYRTGRRINMKKVMTNLHPLRS